MNSTGNLIDEGFNNASITNPSGQQFKLGGKSYWVWKACRGGSEKKALLKDYSTEFQMVEADAKKELDHIIEALENKQLVKDEA